MKQDIIGHKKTTARLKTKRAVLFMLTAILLVGCATQQQRAEQKARTQAAVREAVTKRHWHIDVTTMNTMRYGSRTVTPDFFLELHGDTLRSYLPYLGQVHQAPMLSPSQGLNFEVPLLNYQESRPKSYLSLMEMDVKTQEDSYHYRVELYDTGLAYIQVLSQNRDLISFDGNFDETYNAESE